MSFSATGEHCLTAGADGAVLLHSVQASGKAHLSQLPVQLPGLTNVHDVDAMDDESEATEVPLEIFTLLSAVAQELLLFVHAGTVRFISLHGVALALRKLRQAQKTDCNTHRG